MQRETLYLRSIALNGLPEFIEKLGGDSAALFLEVGLNPSDAKDGDKFISWPKACDLLELAAKKLNEPQFGIKWALNLPDDFQNSGPMVFIARLVPDVRGFLDLALKYQKIHSNGSIHGLEDNVEAGLATWSVYMHPLTPACRQFAEHIMAVIVQMASRHLVDIRFARVSFQHSEPDDMSLYDQAFRCPVIFNASKLEIAGDRAYLERRLGGSLSFLRPLLNMYLDRRKRKTLVSEAPMKNRIEEILPSIFGAGKSDSTSVAIALSLSPKKMQRLLKEENTHFSHIRDSVRHEMTKRLLLGSDISITHLANALDYSSNEAFNTACKRWCGVSPRRYRQRLRQSPST